MGVSNIVCGDDRIYNSIYIKGEYEIDNRWKWPTTGFGLEGYNKAENIHPVSAGGNLYYNGARPLEGEAGSSVAESFDPGIEIIEKEGAIYLRLSYGTSVELNADYFGNKRNPDNPAVGPFESSEPGEHLIKIWPKE